jgi:hypothetical protein
VAEFAEFTLETGGTVTVELDRMPGVMPAGGKSSILLDTKMSLEKALIDVRDAAATALEQFQKMASQPSEVEITFGVKLDAQAGAVIAKTSIQGHFEVKLKWERESMIEKIS